MKQFPTMGIACAPQREPQRRTTRSPTTRTSRLDGRRTIGRRRRNKVFVSDVELYRRLGVGRGQEDSPCERLSPQVFRKRIACGATSAIDRRYGSSSMIAISMGDHLDMRRRHLIGLGWKILTRHTLDH